MFAIAGLSTVSPALHAQFTFTTNNGAITIIGYTDTNPVVSIPGNINGYVVARIGDNAFFGKSITALNIPDSITNIGNAAFEWSSLTSVRISQYVTGIGDLAFCDCISLTAINVDLGNPAYTSVAGILFDKSETLLVQYPLGNAATFYAIPDSVATVGDAAFCNCSSLISIAIPKNVTSIGYQAFCDCRSTTEIVVDSSNPAYTSLAGALFNKSQTTLIQYPIGNLASSYSIPNGVTSIADGAFATCSSLTTVTFPTTIANLGGWTFWSCSSLTNVYFMGNQPSADCTDFARDPTNLTAFYGCCVEYAIKEAVPFMDFL